MYVILSRNENDEYCVKDTKDGVSEWVSEDVLLYAVKQGINIKGACSKSGRWRFNPVDTSEIFKRYYTRVLLAGRDVPEVQRTIYGLKLLSYSKNEDVAYLPWFISRVGESSLANLRAQSLETECAGTQVASGKSLFESSLFKSVDISNWDLSEVTTCERMFHDCENLERVVLGKQETARLLNTSYMFEDCWRLPSIDISGWDLSEVYSCKGMFRCCFRLKDLNLGTQNMQRLSDAIKMFDGCKRLERVALSGWAVADAVNCEFMFSECEDLKEIDFGVKPFLVNDIRFMFADCRSLTKLDLTMFDTSCCYTTDSFLYRSAVKELVVSDKFRFPEKVDVLVLLNRCQEDISITVVSGNTRTKMTKVEFLDYLCKNRVKFRR